MRTLVIGVVVAAALAGGAARADSVVPDPFAPGAAATPEAKTAAKPAAKAAAETARKSAEKSADKTSDEPADKSADKPKPHRRAATKRAPGDVTVTVVNKRTVGLVELNVGPAGGEMKTVQGALAFGRKAVVHVARAKDCLYDLKARFADDADSEHNGVDLCKDKTINLTDE